jgi:hypothetical protein
MDGRFGFEYHLASALSAVFENVFENHCSNVNRLLFLQN